MMKFMKYDNINPSSPIEIANKLYMVLKKYDLSECYNNLTYFLQLVINNIIYLS